MVQFRMRLRFNNFPSYSKFDSKLVNNSSRYARDDVKNGLFFIISGQVNVSPRRNVQ